MAVCGLSLHLGSSESRKTQEQKFIFQIGILNSHGINERFHSTNSSCFNPQFLQSLWRRANARNVSFFTLYSGQFTFSTQLLTLNYQGVKAWVVNITWVWVANVTGAPVYPRLPPPPTRHPNDTHTGSYLRLYLRTIKLSVVQTTSYENLQ